MIPFGSETWNKFGGSVDRDMTLIAKPGTHDPSKNLGNIWMSDAMSPSGRVTDTLADRSAKLKETRDFMVRLGNEKPHGWQNFRDYLHDDFNTDWRSMSHASEMKLYKDQPVTPQNFSGALLNRERGPDTTAVIAALKKRKLPYEFADYNKPEEMFDIADWLQKQSIK